MFTLAIRKLKKMMCVDILSKRYYFSMLLIPETSCEFFNWTSCCGGWKEKKSKQGGERDWGDMWSWVYLAFVYPSFPLSY